MILKKLYFYCPDCAQPVVNFTFMGLPAEPPPCPDCDNALIWADIVAQVDGVADA